MWCVSAGALQDGFDTKRERVCTVKIISSFCVLNVSFPVKGRKIEKSIGVVGG